MNLILKESGKLLTVLEQDDEVEAPMLIISPAYCPGCLVNHMVVFEHFGMHDDGEIYELRMIH